MTLTQRIFAVTASLVLLTLVLSLVRQKQMAVDYSILWVLISGVIVLLSAWYGFLEFLSRLIGAVTPTTTLFIFGTIFLIALNIHYSVRLSELSRRNKVLVQEMALLRHDLTESVRHKGEDSR